MERQNTARRRQWILNTCAGAGALAMARPGAVWAANAVAADLDDIKGALVRVLDDGLVGLGFVTKMEGKTFVVTNASVVSGHNRLSFKTLDGEELKPRKIELSATRDLARFLVAAKTSLPTALPDVGDRVSVPVYGEAAVKTYVGKATKLAAGMIETDAAFPVECRGAPLLNAGDTVAGVASHLTYFKAENRSWKGQKRAFAYQLDAADWYAADWKSYNRTFGKYLRDTDEFREALYAVAAKWIEDPKKKIETGAEVGVDFARWIKAHNNLVTVSERDIKSSLRGEMNRKLRKRFQENCDELAEICRSKADYLWFLCEDKKTTKYLRTQFKWRSLELKKFCAFIALHAKRNEKTSWV